MTEYTLYSTIEDKKSKLRLWFVVTGLVATFLIVLLITAGGYYLLRAYGLQSSVELISAQIEDIQAEQASELSTDREAGPNSDMIKLDTLESDASEPNETDFADLGKRIKNIDHVKEVALFGRLGELLWTSDPALNLSAAQRADRAQVYTGKLEHIVYDIDLLRPSSWRFIVQSDSAPLDTLLRINGLNEPTIAVAKLSVDFNPRMASAWNFGVKLFVFVLLGNLILFLLLYYNFRNGIKTIEEQEQKLNQQILRLSNLLTINKSMQQSMKTASSRAVELNEQFLRRVGADLHDGPAQMIGYSVLRLNQISRTDAAKQFGHEFHAVKEALDEALDEIRGISSGLVLPELENMSLEQCLRKVVSLHGVKSNSEIAQYYIDIDCDIPLPVKITAYRFVQEGLNNSHRHGQAEKCRITAQVKEGVLQLSLKDNGMGFRMSQLKAEGGHLGLLGLKDRVESLGGKFSINSELGIGTALKLFISLTDDETH